MPITSGPVIYKFGTMQQYKELQTKNTNTIYIITDAQKIFIGEKEYGGVGNI